MIVPLWRCKHVGIEIGGREGSVCGMTLTALRLVKCATLNGICLIGSPSRSTELQVYSTGPAPFPRLIAMAGGGRSRVHADADAGVAADAAWHGLLEDLHAT